jgi:hypothetical protein
MGAVPVVERFELAQCVHQVGLIPDQRPVEQLAPAGLHPVGLDYSGSVADLRVCWQAAPVIGQPW